MTSATKNRVQGAGIALSGPMAELREREIRLLYDVAQHVGPFGTDGAQDRQRLLDTASDLREMFFMVVVIGEFNAGKSTFVNALLGDELLPMGITPTTDAIELVRYGPTRGRRTDQKPEHDAIREWSHPNTTIPGVVIVDTPGTGSVFQKHEQVAKSFLHRSDLVIFVISAKRAFAETERLYLELARNYGKKIIIVINQSDLLDARELGEVKAFVHKQVDELLGIRPSVFMVSAKKALLGEKASGTGGLFANRALRRGTERDDWGMDEVRDYLRQTFEQVPPAKQKLLTPLELLRTVVTRRRAVIQAKLTLIGSDTNAAEDLKREIDQQATGLDQQLNSTLRDLHTTFDGMRSRGAAFVEKHINVIHAIRSRGIDKEALRTEFNNDVVGNALQQASSISEHYVNSVVDGGRVYWRSVIDRLNKMEALLREESGSMDAATYADQRAALQEAMTMADVEMRNHADHRLIEELQTDFESNTRNFLYSTISSILGALAAFLAIITPGVVAAHPLAVLGLSVGAPIAILGAGAAAIIWRKAVGDAQRKLNDNIQGLEDSYEQSLVQLTTRERNRLVQYGSQILAPVFSQLQALAARYKDQQNELDAFLERAKDIESDLEHVSP
ncbi:MAG TPA: dynamin family protein [Aggregatilineales bacterium]|nr:dynamin family protein [Aggregatilineales bacterium]